MDMQKKVLAINDISCAGRCSLTVALPILSAAGLETRILPTAILSTHTGGFEGYTFLDFTDEMMKIADHWKSLDLKFDAIYTGYLGSGRQIDIVSDIIDMFRDEHTLVYVDPVMGDGGALYAGFNENFPKGMARLCGKADIIVPNITEASLMLGERYIDKGYDRRYIESLAAKLSDLGPEKIVISGVAFNEGEIGCCVYDSKSGRAEYGFTDFVATLYHGTGDVFGSALLGAYMSGKSLMESAEIAMRYTRDSIYKTSRASSEKRFGVEFETGLGWLADKVNN